MPYVCPPHHVSVEFRTSREYELPIVMADKIIAVKSLEHTKPPPLYFELAMCITRNVDRDIRGF